MEYLLQIKYATNIEGKEIILTNLSDKKLNTLSQFDRQLCAVQVRMFELSLKKGFLSREFIDLYMQSKTAEYFYLPFDRTQWLGEENLLFDFLEEKPNLQSGELYSSGALFWIGYTYRYWHYLTGQNSKDIVKICDAQTMYTLHPAYHTLDCTMAIERILEAKEFSNS